MKIRQRATIGGICGACNSTLPLFESPHEHTPRCAACMDAEDVRRTHEIKTWPPFFGSVFTGKKPFEFRRDDRHYRVGDLLDLREWEPTEGNMALDPKKGKYTGRRVVMRVTYCLRASRMMPGLESGYVVLGITPAYDGKEE